MSQKSLIQRCPFRDGTASKKLFDTLAASKKPLEIAKRAKVSVEKTTTLARSYVNPFHMAPLKRVGVMLVRDGEGRYALKACKADAKARRPERGKKANKTRLKRFFKRRAPKRAVVVREEPAESGVAATSPISATNVSS